MARQHRTSGSLQSIAGGALVGLGLHIWFGNLQGLTGQLTHLLGTSSGETLGLASSVIVAAAQAGRVYASDHQGFFLEVLRMLVSFWPLLLVIVGADSLRDVFTDEVDSFDGAGKIFPK